ncbi:hypothetical protein CPHO_00030 [Corynebacterium phocae]|uniref:Uncharacterized protein n=1 Tax=Corynebacterium phocae TaxID=161895 RepID=A0A1L7D0B7_9CORY|nr:hypothetical protein [Corynebacterium phocae]APT91589.1 hypothetical protein CPHO_00030 [Corynebacterium phocae]KAA8720656.1 hypothetical protein F4V58_11885 [Corynebacterium phocae]
MPKLAELLSPGKREATVADIAALAEDTVAKQSGLTGMAIKGAVGAAKKLDSNIIAKGTNRMLPEILAELEPLWQEFEDSSATDFGEFVVPRSGQVTNALMSVADRQAETIDVAALSKAYRSLRGQATKVVEPEVPELARILHKHM